MRLKFTTQQPLNLKLIPSNDKDGLFHLGINGLVIVFSHAGINLSDQPVHLTHLLWNFFYLLRKSDIKVVARHGETAWQAAHFISSPTGLIQ